ncbi:hypothetical protein PR048_017419 [Dryococelus australis]|uniref:Tesmin/TSO1-like CXC domain-containing protein n=1 Tax=Dryococelus australis TaxID=614101 RepID=A0ABQ9H9M1_9NEOP|nr:hypothetical protein PR048_017419 [Dryococelus australis]
MRKTKKSVLYDAFPLCSSSVDLKMSYTVVDGGCGFLLHRVKWNVGTKFSSICEHYVSYLINHCGANSAVVFDGYEDVNSTKCAEQKQRVISKTSVDVNFDGNMLATVQQENFLANEKNKTKLIELLVETLTARGIEVSTTIGDADGSILSPDRNVYFMKPGRGNIEDNVYSTRQLQELHFSGSILFIHSFTGCDTTCAIFNKSKLSILKCFLKRPNDTIAIADIFYDPTTPDAVAQTGEEMFLTMYQAPPSEQRWGWVRDDDGALNPVKRTDQIAPYSVLNSIFCRCASGCGGRCGCWEAGIHCSSICGCDGACMNSAPIQEEDVEEDEYFMDFEDMTEL